MNRKIVYQGSGQKWAINLNPIDGVTMDDYDFEVDIYCAPLLAKTKMITVPKNQTRRINENSYVVRLFTTELGTGDLWLRVRAYLPDPDFNDGIRPEVLYFDTGLYLAAPL